MSKREEAERQVGGDIERRNLQQRKEELESFTIRLNKRFRQELSAHFRLKYDLSLSAGIRMVLTNYADREQIRGV